jgi:hypothetical protein
VGGGHLAIRCIDRTNGALLIDGDTDPPSCASNRLNYMRLVTVPHCWCHRRMTSDETSHVTSGDRLDDSKEGIAAKAIDSRDGDSPAVMARSSKCGWLCGQRRPRGCGSWSEKARIRENV